MYNYKAFEAIKEQIDAHPKRFDMRYYFYPHGDCGTIMCLAGWTCYLFDAEKFNLVVDSNLKTSYDGYFPRKAAEILGLEEDEKWLFRPWHSKIYIQQILESLLSQKDKLLEEQKSVNEIAKELNINFLKHRKI